MTPRILSAGLLFVAGTFALAQQVDTSKWQTVSTKDGTFSIKAPKTWLSTTGDDPETKQGREIIRKENPAIAKLIDQGGDQYDLYLIDTASEVAKGVNNMNLKSMDRSGMTTDSYSDIAKEVISQAKLQNSGYKEVTLPVGKAVTYSGTLDVAIGNGQSITVKLIAYFIIKGEKAYFVTFGTIPERESKEKPIFEAMAKSIVIK